MSWTAPFSMQSSAAFTSNFTSRSRAQDALRNGPGVPGPELAGGQPLDPRDERGDTLRDGKLAALRSYHQLVAGNNGLEDGLEVPGVEGDLDLSDLFGDGLLDLSNRHQRQGQWGDDQTQLRTFVVQSHGPLDDLNGTGLPQNLDGLRRILDEQGEERETDYLALNQDLRALQEGQANLDNSVFDFGPHSALRFSNDAEGLNALKLNDSVFYVLPDRGDQGVYHVNHHFVSADPLNLDQAADCLHVLDDGIVVGVLLREFLLALEGAFRDPLSDVPENVVANVEGGEQGSQTGYLAETGNCCQVLVGGVGVRQGHHREVAGVESDILVRGNYFQDVKSRLLNVLIGVVNEHCLEDGIYHLSLAEVYITVRDCGELFHELDSSGNERLVVYVLHDGLFDPGYASELGDGLGRLVGGIVAIVVETGGDNLHALDADEGLRERSVLGRDGKQVRGALGEVLVVFDVGVEELEEVSHDECGRNRGGLSDEQGTERLTDGRGDLEVADAVGEGGANGLNASSLDEGVDVGGVGGNSSKDAQRADDNSAGLVGVFLVGALGGLGDSLIESLYNHGDTSLSNDFVGEGGDVGHGREHSEGVILLGDV
ncbi:hypothetical protein HWI79_3755 [Cryptosporidium felis]|nr:hypothetical protein HWI79_3755 [Cryptosporidium felis]